MGKLIIPIAISEDLSAMTPEIGQLIYNETDASLRIGDGKTMAGRVLSTGKDIDLTGYATEVQLDKVSESVTVLDGTVTAIEGRVSTLQSTVNNTDTGLSIKVAANTNDINTLRKDVNSNKTKIANVEAQCNRLLENGSGLVIGTTEGTAYEGSAGAALAQSVSALQVTINGSTASTGLVARVQALQQGGTGGGTGGTTDTDLADRVTALQEIMYDSQDGTIEGLSSRVSTLQSTTGDIQNTVSDIGDRVTTLQSKVDQNTSLTLGTTIGTAYEGSAGAALQDDITTLEYRVDQLYARPTTPTDVLRCSQYTNVKVLYSEPIEYQTDTIYFILQSQV